MSIPQLSKYIIIFLFAVVVILSAMLGIYSLDNKLLTKDNTRLKEQVLLQEVAIQEIGENIERLKKQVSEAENICNDRLKARADLLTFLGMEDVSVPYSSSDIYGAEGTAAPDNNKVGNFETVTHNKVVRDEVVSKNKSDYAVNSINSYWLQFTRSSSGKK